MLVLKAERCRQGLYSAEGDIVVLCAYLGQLARVRDALAQEVAVVLDERDQAELDDRDAEKDVVQGSNVVVEHVKVSRRVRSRHMTYTFSYISSLFIS